MNRSLTRLSLALVAVLLVSSGVMANCTQGFWKNHEEYWCTDTLQLGDVVYTQEQLLSIFNLEVSGNGLVSLAHQLIAAKLNVACGVPGTDCIAEADALIGPLVVPPVGSGYLDTAITSPLVECLTAFNESMTPPGYELPCDPTSVDPSSWGQVKGTYR
jgi:hypothetical protein